MDLVVICRVAAEKGGRESAVVGMMGLADAQRCRSIWAYRCAKPSFGGGSPHVAIMMGGFDAAATGNVALFCI
jgi:hypothetical protein